jgi:ribosomal protein S18 acetylase RimI-like enzyme
VKIRQATAADERALRVLDRATWTSESSPAPTPPPERSFFGAECAPRDVLVALDDGQMVGYIRIAPPTPLESNRHVLEIRGLSVDPVRRRQGIGRALLDAAAEEAAGRGVRRLTLHVLGHNKTARAAYARSGFTVEGVLREEFEVNGRYVDDVLMARLIVPADSARPRPIS